MTLDNKREFLGFLLPLEAKVGNAQAAGVIAYNALDILRKAIRCFSISRTRTHRLI
jgi:hypothetical protein